MSRKARTPRRTGLSASAQRALQAVYAEIPNIPGCTGQCAEACGPIAMFKGEWERIKAVKGGEPKVRQRLVCPMLSPTGKCTVYTVRPYICRLWGATRQLACPQGCEPERWLSIEESQDIFARVREIAGPQIAGPLGSITDLWQTIGLEQREQRSALIAKLKEEVADEQPRTA